MMTFRPAACAAAFVAAFFSGGAPAQLSGPATDLPALAQAALGNELGMATVAGWRGGAMQQATVYRAERGKSAAAWTDDGAQMYEIGSVSKVFTGLLLAQAVERGHLKLEDKLGELLKDKVPVMTPGVAAVNLRQLVTHSSCLPRQAVPPRSIEDAGREIRNYTREQLWEALGKVPGGSPPCARDYSNFGFAILGELLAVRYGTTWEALVRDRITGPVGMKDTVVELGPRRERMAAPFDGEVDTAFWDMRAYAGAGGLRSTAADMLLFARAVAAGRKGPLGPAAERLVTPLGASDGEEIGYGVMLRGKDGKKVAYHYGLTGGYTTWWAMLPAGEAIFVSVSNQQAPIRKVVSAVDASLFPVASAPVAVAPADLAAFEGTYRYGRDESFSFVARDGVLYGKGARTGFFPLVAVAPRRFTRPSTSTQFDFERDGAHAGRVLLAQGGRTFFASRDEKARPPGYAIPPRESLAAYTGRYQLRPGVTIDVTEEEGQLLARLTRQWRFPVFAKADARDRFVYEIVKAELQFERDGAGKVVAVVLHQNGEQRAPRIGG